MNIQNGILELSDKLRIEPGLTEKAFLNSKAGSGSLILVNNDDYVSYKTQPQLIEGIQFVLVLYFKSKMLLEVHLHLFDKYFSSWSIYSKEEEIDRKSRLDNWLYVIAGIPPYRYQWGDIVSIHDEKAGMSFILVRYNMNSEKKRT